MVIAHRDELIQQAAEKMEAITGYKPDIEKADSFAPTKSMFDPSPIVVASVQTLISGRGDFRRMHRFDPDNFDLLIVDECHHAIAASYRNVLNHFKQNPNHKLLGVTATPDRTDEQALGQVFETVAFEYSILDAIGDGYLVPVNQQCITIDSLNFDEMRTTAGDLNGADLARVMEYESNLHAVASPTMEIVGDRKSIVFTSSVAHAQRLAEIFNRHNPNCAIVVHGKTDEDERREKVSAFRRGDYQYLCNCGVFLEGFDVPDVSCIVMARPTKSRSLYSQMAGRGTRPIASAIDNLETADERKKAIENSAKPNLLVLDFVGNSTKHHIIHATDVLGGDYSDEVIELAQRSLEKANTPRPVIDELQKAERKLREQREQKEAKRRRHVTAKAEYTATTKNIYDWFEVPFVRSRGWDEGKQISDRQREVLEKAGFNPDKMEYGQAKNALIRIFHRMENNLCTYRQAKALERMGYTDTKNITFAEASAIISQRFGNNKEFTPRAPLCAPGYVKKQDEVPF